MKLEKLPSSRNVLKKRRVLPNKIKVDVMPYNWCYIFRPNKNTVEILIPKSKSLNLIRYHFPKTVAGVATITREGANIYNLTIKEPQARTKGRMTVTKWLNKDFAKWFDELLRVNGYAIGNDWYALDVETLQLIKDMINFLRKHPRVFEEFMQTVSPKSNIQKIKQIFHSTKRVV